MNQPQEELTNHAMLVLLGQFAEQIGLIASLEAIPLRQKTRNHRPQTKVIEFLVTILAGFPHLKDISHSAHPLDRDDAVARAWKQPAWANYSGVSRSLSAMTMTEAQQIVQSLDEIAQPFIIQEINRALLHSEHLLWDVDLTGRPVSSGSTSYPNAAYGYMSDGVRLGYQAAMVSMDSPTYGRLWLSTTPHPGDTVSCTQAEDLVLVAEAKSGVRPQRRTHLLLQRLAQAQERVKAAQRYEEQARQALSDVQQRLAESQELFANRQDEVVSLEIDYQSRRCPEGPYSKVVKARKRLAVQQRRCERRYAILQRAHRRVARKGAILQQTQSYAEMLTQRLQRFQQENAANPTPLRITLRMDAGFGTVENIALLIEMGYELYTKPRSHQITAGLKRTLDQHSVWNRVGHNAEMVAWSEKIVGNCPYPLDVALERFHVGKSGLQYSTLLHYGDQPVTDDLPAWFHAYNGRQTIEAGIKEGKNVFTMHHFKVRSQAGLFLQEHFAAFAANFVRWTMHWLTEQSAWVSNTHRRLSLSGIQNLVQVAAHTSAWVIWQSRGCLLRFTDSSVFAGQSIQVGEGCFQLPLPLFKSYNFASI
jgi:hypothetical protein